MMIWGVSFWMPLFVQTKQDDVSRAKCGQRSYVHVHVPSVARRPLDEPQIIRLDVSG